MRNDCDLPSTECAQCHSLLSPRHLVQAKLTVYDFSQGFLEWQCRQRGGPFSSAQSTLQNSNVTPQSLRPDTRTCGKRMGTALSYTLRCRLSMTRWSIDLALNGVPACPTLCFTFSVVLVLDLPERLLWKDVRAIRSSCLSSLTVEPRRCTSRWENGSAITWKTLCDLASYYKSRLRASRACQCRIRFSLCLLAWHVHALHTLQRPGQN